MLSWFRRRDATIYPEDEMGEALFAKHPRPEAMPARLALWYDVYFERREDADAFDASFRREGIETVRDHDEDMLEEGLGAWNVDLQIPERARHHELTMRHRTMLRAIEDHRGKLGSWLLLEADAGE
jgi:hypothetical protein